MERSENSDHGTKSGHGTREKFGTRDAGQKRETRIVKGIILKTRFEKGDEVGEFFGGGRDMINSGQADLLCFKRVLANSLNFDRG